MRYQLQMWNRVKSEWQAYPDYAATCSTIQEAEHAQRSARETLRIAKLRIAALPDSDTDEPSGEQTKKKLDTGSAAR